MGWYEVVRLLDMSLDRNAITRLGPELESDVSATPYIPWDIRPLYQLIRYIDCRRQQLDQHHSYL